MARYRAALPQLGGDLFLTDGGIETSMIVLEGLALPEFAAFPLLASPEGEAALRRYFRSYAEIARRYGVGLVLESATWRASADWGARLGLTPVALAGANREAIESSGERARRVRDRVDEDRDQRVPGPAARRLRPRRGDDRGRGGRRITARRSRPSPAPPPTWSPP